ncbi:hypothetical protein TNCV_119901 [Trichonephila clavipes]|nr:hypothetical protein TNCV_119901 [Trichonephila clavipes]
MTLLLLSCVYHWDTYERREIDEQKHITQSQMNIDFIISDDPRKEQKRYTAFLSRRESISGEISISFSEDTSVPYSGIKPEPTRLQAEYHNHQIEWRSVVITLYQGSALS